MPQGGVSSHATYDSANHPLTRTDTQDSHTTSYAYDNSRQPDQAHRPGRQRHQLTPSTATAIPTDRHRSRRPHLALPTYDSVGDLAQGSAADGAGIRRPTSTTPRAGAPASTDPDGRVTHYAYDPDSRPKLSTTDGAGGTRPLHLDAVATG